MIKIKHFYLLFKNTKELCLKNFRFDQKLLSFENWTELLFKRCKIRFGEENPEEILELIYKQFDICRKYKSLEEIIIGKI